MDAQDNNHAVIFRVHAIRRMFARSISRDEVLHVIQYGSVITQYADDRPYPSRLILGWVNERPLHIVVADNSVDCQIIVITAYEPDVSIWYDGFERRRQ